MGQLKRTIFFLCFVTCCLQAQGADKYTDENRPYEFGFSIDGEQHRHEKKDKNGIIMGEFGFITADGVYHVTVYATDEQGRFKILSMKNIRVKPYPGTSAEISTYKPTGVKKGHSLPFPPSQDNVSTVKSQKPEKDNIFSPAKSCSHCSIPTTTTFRPANIAYTNNQESENTSKSQASNVSPGNHSQESLGTKINDSQKTKPVSPDSNILNNYSSENTGLNYQKPQVNNQNEQGFGQVNSNDRSPDLSSNQQGLDNNNNDDVLQTPYLEPNLQTPITDKNNNDNKNTQPFKSYQNNLQVSSFENKPQNIDDIQTYQQHTPALPTNTVDKNVDDNTQIIPNDNTKNRQQFNSDQNKFLGFEPKNKPLGINKASVYQINDKENIGQPDGYTETQTQNSRSESSNLNNPGSQEKAKERNPKQFGSFGQSQPGEIQKPMLVAAQMQIVNKNTDINYKKPGEEDGLPNGITKGDMEHLLYTFNYTVGFHGHFEEGFTSGSKQGYYFVTSRNGVRTRIDYTADETGFHPKISQEVLDLLSDEVPKPETEKNERYGLKGYEFKWLYYPVGSKR